MLSAAEILLESSGDAWWPSDKVEVDRSFELIKSSLDEDDFMVARRRGIPMGIDQTVQFAINE